MNRNTEIKALWENSVITPTTYTVTVSNDGNGTGTASPSTAAAGTTITLTATPKTGYHFKEWQVISGSVTIKDDTFTMPDSEVEIKAIFEEDAPPVPTDPAKPNISVTGTYTYNGSVHTATVSGYDPPLWTSPATPPQTQAITPFASHPRPANGGRQHWGRDRGVEHRQSHAGSA